MKGQEAEEDYIMRSFIISTFYQLLLGLLNQGKRNGSDMRTRGIDEN
jgi:hypothetical protein